MFSKVITFVIALVIDYIILKIVWNGVKTLSPRTSWMRSSMAVATKIVTTAPKYALVKK